ncbi:MAG TPA: ATP synthase F0 subunit B [Myxococcales bacterium]|jgi:F-type H+-transporting ATPase subunit b|nr:ATP synthase F0 subunit B [Myxococcales bacterium]
MLPSVDFAVLGAFFTDINPGLTFWTIVTFLVVFFVLRSKAWGPILQMVEQREKAIQDAIDAAKRERQEAERMLAEQKQAIAEARREAAEMVKRNQADVEKIREELLARSRKEAEEMMATAMRQIEEEKLKAMAEVRSHAVDLSLLAAGQLIESSLDERRQRELVSEYIRKLEAERPAA